MLPRLPLVEKPADFWAFSKAGRTLAELHLKYETQPPHPDVVVSGAEQGKFRVEKMRFPDKQDKTTIEYNPWITISAYPAGSLRVCGERADPPWNGSWSATRSRRTRPAASPTTPTTGPQNRGKPRYILDLLLSVITVSVETVKIVNGLPGLEIKE